MKVTKFEVGPIGANTYILWDEKTKKGVIIDPGDDDPRITEFIDHHGIVPEKILLTHGHFDHIGGIDALRERYQVKVAVHKNDAPMLTSESLNMSGVFGGGIVFRDPEILLSDGDEISVAPGFSLAVLHTPGHSKGSVCFIGGGMIFTGDTLFAGSCGRTDFPDGSMGDMKTSLSKLSGFDDNLMVYPGHGPDTTIGLEKQYNPFLQT